MPKMDISLVLNKICPKAEYFGSLTDNTYGAYRKLDWRDERPKPSWEEIKAAWLDIKPEVLAELKKVKKDTIDAKTDALKATVGFELDGKRFSMSEGAYLQWFGLQMLGLTGRLQYPKPILTVDDEVFLLVDEAALTRFMDKVESYQTSDSDSPIVQGRVLRARVESAASQEELDAIVDDRA